MLMVTREIQVCEKKIVVAEVPLRGKRAEGRVALVSPEDFEAVNAAGPWYIAFMKGHVQYARRSGDPRWMHRFILGDHNGQVDHIDHDGLQNSRDNIFKTTYSCNQLHRVIRDMTRSSPFLGVSKNKGGGWTAAVGVKGKVYRAGPFVDAVEAALRYDQMKREAASESGCVAYTVNFPNPGEFDARTGLRVCSTAVIAA